MIAPLSRLSPTMPATSQQEGHNEQLNPLHRSNTLNVFSAPAGNTVVGEVPAYERVYLMDGGLLRDSGVRRQARRERRFATRLGDL